MSNQTGDSNPATPSADNWQPCAAGEVSGMVQRIQRRRRATTIARVTSVAACLLATVALLQLQPFAATSGPPGGITCGEALQHRNEYQAGELAGQKLADQIREHLADCPHCAEKFEPEPGSPQASENLPSERPVARSAELNPRLIAGGF